MKRVALSAVVFAALAATVVGACGRKGEPAAPTPRAEEPDARATN